MHQLIQCIQRNNNATVDTNKVIGNFITVFTSMPRFTSNYKGKYTNVYINNKGWYIGEKEKKRLINFQ